MFFSVRAKVRISMAGTMAAKPLVMQAVASLKVMTLRHSRYTKVIITATMLPQGSPTEASVSAKESTRLAPSQKPPTYIIPIMQKTISTITGISISQMEAPGTLCSSSLPREPTSPFRAFISALAMGP